MWSALLIICEKHLLSKKKMFSLFSSKFKTKNKLFIRINFDNVDSIEPVSKFNLIQFNKLSRVFINTWKFAF